MELTDEQKQLLMWAAEGYEIRTNNDATCLARDEDVVCVPIYDTDKLITPLLELGCFWQHVKLPDGVIYIITPTGLHLVQSWHVSNEALGIRPALVKSIKPGPYHYVERYADGVLHCWVQSAEGQICISCKNPSYNDVVFRQVVAAALTLLCQKVKHTR